ncbi:hypothetical protein Tco_0079929 [Tanacetum coccineum]
MQADRDCQKSYADVRKPLEFQVGDRVMLKVTPWKGVVRFGKRGKLNPRTNRGILERRSEVKAKLYSHHQSSMELQERSRVHVGNANSVSEEITRSSHKQTGTLEEFAVLSLGTRALLTVETVHSIFRSVAYTFELPEELSRVHNTFHVSNLKKCHADEPLAVLLDGLHFDNKLQFIKEPVEIMDREVKRLKRSCIPLVKVRWNSRRGPEFTWEREDQFRKKYPHLFTKTAPSSSAAS